MNIQPNKNGYFGEFGGAFIPEMLFPNVNELQQNYLSIINDSDFQLEFPVPKTKIYKNGIS